MALRMTGKIDAFGMWYYRRFLSFADREESKRIGPEDLQRYISKVEYSTVKAVVFGLHLPTWKRIQFRDGLNDCEKEECHPNVEIAAALSGLVHSRDLWCKVVSTTPSRVGTL